MIKWLPGISRRSEHPLANPNEVRQILANLPVSDSLAALDELAQWHASIAEAEDVRLERRGEVIRLLDEAAQAHLRKVSRDYLATPRLAKVHEQRMWNAAHGYLEEAGNAYLVCVDRVRNGIKGADAIKNQLVLLSGRAMRALAQRVKWLQFRYGPVESRIWDEQCKLFRFAEARKFVDTKIELFPGWGETTMELEFLRSVVFAASSPDGLTPPELDTAERLITRFLPDFQLTQHRGADTVYWIDLDKNVSPLRILREPEPGVTDVRFVCAGPASAALESLLRDAGEIGEVPDDLLSPGISDAGTVVEVMRHLVGCWNPKAPQRRSPRHRVKTRISVLHGFEQILGVLDGVEANAYHDGESESWVVEDVSSGGFRAGIPHLKGDWVRIDKLIALQPEGATNWVVGLIRRVQRDAEAHGNVGIETITRAPRVVDVRPSEGLPDAEAMPVILLADAAGTAGEAQLLMPPERYQRRQNLEMSFQGRLHLLLPQSVVSEGEDFVLARFRELIREFGDE